MSTKKKSKRGGARPGAGRKRLAERRERKVLASFTPSEYAVLSDEADEEGVTVAELVAQRAVFAR